MCVKDIQCVTKIPYYAFALKHPPCQPNDYVVDKLNYAIVLQSAAKPSSNIQAMQ